MERRVLLIETRSTSGQPSRKASAANGLAADRHTLPSLFLVPHGASEWRLAADIHAGACLIKSEFEDDLSVRLSAAEDLHLVCYTLCGIIWRLCLLHAVAGRSSGRAICTRPFLGSAGLPTDSPCNLPCLGSGPRKGRLLTARRTSSLGANNLRLKTRHSKAESLHMIYHGHRNQRSRYLRLQYSIRKLRPYEGSGQKKGSTLTVRGGYR